MSDVAKCFFMYVHYDFILFSRPITSHFYGELRIELGWEKRLSGKILQKCFKEPNLN